MSNYSYIIKFSGDIGTKQRRTKWKIIQKLYGNILKGLKFDKNEVIESKLHWSHLFLITKNDATERLKFTPGIQHFSPVVITSLLSAEDIMMKAKEIFAHLVKNKYFAVRVKNANYNKVDYSKRELEKEIGAVLYPFAKGVNLSNPDITCFIEIREQNVYFFAEKINGISGFPVGTSKESVVLYSGGIDSPVATYRTLRMGILPHFIFYDLGGDAQLHAARKTLTTLYGKFMPFQENSFYIVPFTEIMTALQGLPNKYQNLGLKVFFYLFAEKMARYRNWSNIITGESVGQVSTQTISNLALLERFTEYPVFRPLGFYSKIEIMNIAREIGTMEESFQGVENCALAVKNVSTKGKYKELKQYIDKLPVDELLQNAIQNTKKLLVSEFVSSEFKYTQTDNLEPVTIGENAVIIDLSENDNSLQDKRIKKISFNDAWQSFFDWDTDVNYYIYCENGVKSKTLANFMREQGFKAEHIKNIKL
jgi:thiamine biosynthesis protein ThiI